MSLDTTRANLIANIWKAIAQSGVDLSSLPRDQQEKLVSKITDQMLITLDELLDEIPIEENADTKPSSTTDEFEENILWEGRPFLSLVEHYTITSERIKIVSGLFGKDIENFELIRIQDLDVSRGMTERLLNLGDIHIQGQDASQSKIILRNIKAPEAVYEQLRRAWLEARKRHGLQFREYM